MAGEWISQLIPTIVIIIMVLGVAGVLAYKLLGVANTASIFDAEHNTIARELYINQSGYWIVTVQYVGGIYPVYGIVLESGKLVKVNWPVQIFTVYYPVQYRYVEYDIYAPGSDPPVIVLLKVGSSMVGIKIMPEYRVNLLPVTTTTATAVVAPSTTTVTTYPPIANAITFIVSNDSWHASWAVSDNYFDSMKGNSDYSWIWVYNLGGNGTGGFGPPSWFPRSGQSSNEVYVTAGVSNLGHYICFLTGTLGNGSSVSGYVPLGSTVHLYVNCVPAYVIYINVFQWTNGQGAWTGWPGWHIWDNDSHSLTGQCEPIGLLSACSGMSATWLYPTSIKGAHIQASLSSSGSDGYTCYISPSNVIASFPGANGSTIDFWENCVYTQTSTTTTSTQTITGTSTNTNTKTSTTTTTTTPSGPWSVTVNVNAPSNVGWQISTSPSATIDGVPGASSLDGSGTSSGNTFTYPASVLSASLSGSITISPSGESCSISPSSVTVTPSTGSVTFTVSCSSSTNTGTGTTSTSSTTTTSNSTTTSSTNTGGPTSPTTTATYTTSIEVTTGELFTCVGPGSVQLGQEVVEECVAGWAYPYATYGQLSVWYPTSTGGAVVMSGVITLSTEGSTTNQIPQGFTWGYVGSCGRNQEPEVILSGPSVGENAWTNSYEATWYITVEAYCVYKGSNFIFIMPWDWEPPVLPEWLWLRGGTNTIAPFEPIYIQEFNEYAEWFWSNTGWFIVLMVLIMLITPVIAKPVLSRRIRI